MPKRAIISLTAGVFLLIPVIICRQSVFLADFYASHIYPVLSAVLSKMASVVPFSLQEIVVVTAIILLITVPVMAVKRKWGIIPCILRETEIVLWIAVWLYWGWGMNYFRSSIYARTDTIPAAIDTVMFKSFLYDWTEALNSSYTQQRTIDESSLESEANFWAYQACVHSSDSLTRYSGYYNILVHIWNNAAGILDSTEFNCWKSSIRPEILADLYSERCFWKENEWLFLSKVQSFFYDRFLKSNKIPGGMKNYSAVVSMVITFGELPVSCCSGHDALPRDESRSAQLYHYNQKNQMYNRNQTRCTKFIFLKFKRRLTRLRSARFCLDPLPVRHRN